MVIYAKALNSDKNIIAFHFEIDNTGVSNLADYNFLQYNKKIDGTNSYYSKLLNWEVVNKNLSYGLTNGYTVIKDSYETVTTNDYKVLLRIPCDYFSQIINTTLVSDIPGQNWNIQILPTESKTIMYVEYEVTTNSNPISLDLDDIKEDLLTYFANENKLNIEQEYIFIEFVERSNSITVSMSVEYSGYVDDNSGNIFKFESTVNDQETKQKIEELFKTDTNDDDTNISDTIKITIIDNSQREPEPNRTSTRTRTRATT